MGAPMKVKDRVQSTTPPNNMRFPRLPYGAEVANLAKGVWTAPTFSVNEVDGVTNFVFSVRLRDKIRSDHRKLYWSLFESGGPDWRKTLEIAYASALSGKKTVGKCMDIALYAVFRDALEILMKDAKKDSRNYDELYGTAFNATVDDAAKYFVCSSRRKSGRKRIRQMDESRPIRLFERHQTLTPLVSAMGRLVSKLKA